MKNNAVSLITILTILLAAAVFHFWLPSEISDDYKNFSAKQQTEKAAENPEWKTDSKKIPEDLIAFIRKQDFEKTIAEESEIETGDILKDFEEEYNIAADEILANKFKHFFDSNKEINYEGSEAFQVPEGLEEHVHFWAQIFGRYDRSHMIFYNKSDVSIVYSVLDFSEMAVNGSRGLKKQLVKEERIRIKNMLRKVAKLIKEDKTKRELKKLDLTPEEERLYAIFQKHKGRIKLDEKSLTKSLAYRNGFSHRIRKAIATSGLYMKKMRQIFRERGLPEDLTMIPFIESAFHIKAYSRAHAAGIWQFIPATGRRYLRIDEYVDERYDPILAAYAAASHLSKEYKFLGSWPLTINAYNTGPGRMLKAKKKYGDDITKIVKNFRGSGYGFDSRNYFPEFLAMLHVYHNQEEYFGEIVEKPEQNFEYVVMPATTNVRELLSMSGTDIDTIQRLNPGIKYDVFAGRKELPKGYLVKVPPKRKKKILLAAKDLYLSRDQASYHVVKRGENLEKIASRYSLKEDSIASLNKLIPGKKLRRGEILKLPVEKFDSSVAFIKDGQRQDLLITDPEKFEDKKDKK